MFCGLCSGMDSQHFVGSNLNVIYSLQPQHSWNLHQQQKCLHTSLICAETNHRFQTVSMTNHIELLVQGCGDTLLYVLCVTKTSPATADFSFLIFNWKSLFSSAGYTQIASRDGEMERGWQRERKRERVGRAASKHKSSFPLEMTHQSAEKKQKQNTSSLLRWIKY